MGLLLLNQREKGRRCAISGKGVRRVEMEDREKKSAFGQCLELRQEGPRATELQWYCGVFCDYKRNFRTRERRGGGEKSGATVARRRSTEGEEKGNGKSSRAQANKLPQR